MQSTPISAPTGPAYRGRFAPSPTGALHFGSLIAALGSYLEARRNQGEWRVRIEDLDPPRVVPGAASGILRTLEGFGFEWDGPVVYQSERTRAYEEALARLVAERRVYRCSCSRKQISAAGRVGEAGPIYPGTCRNGSNDRRRRSWRVRTDGACVRFTDSVQGEISVDLEQEIGDFVVRRADGIFAYHLALVVDDAAAGITDVVRGQDLLACSAPQIWLQRLSGLPTPRYMHLPIVVNAEGQKLSKQTHAPALEVRDRMAQLEAALTFLGHPPPRAVVGDFGDLWSWARAHWDSARIPRATHQKIHHHVLP